MFLLLLHLSRHKALEEILPRVQEGDYPEKINRTPFLKNTTHYLSIYAPAIATKVYRIQRLLVFVTFFIDYIKKHCKKDCHEYKKEINQKTEPFF